MTKSICVWYWFIFLPYVSPFLKKNIVEGIKHRCVNKTSQDKGGACANEKRKRWYRIPLDITLVDGNYAAWGYKNHKVAKLKKQIRNKLLQLIQIILVAMHKCSYVYYFSVREKWSTRRKPRWRTWWHDHLTCGHRVLNPCQWIEASANTVFILSWFLVTNRSFLLLEKRRWTTLMRSVRNVVSTNQRINKLIKIILPPTLTFTLSGCWSWLNWAIKANTSIGGDISTLENNEAIFTVDRSSVFLSRSSSGQCCQGALLTSVS